MPTRKRRRLRWKRDRSAPQNLVLTDRDRAIFGHVWRHRLLSSEHLVALLPSYSKQHTIRRLRSLFDARFVDKPRVQYQGVGKAEGSEPDVYALGDRGADVIAEQHGVALEEIDWTSKNRSIKPGYFHHTLMIASIVVRFELACRDRGDVSFTPFAEILKWAPEATQRALYPQTWQVTATKNDSPLLRAAVELGISPDAIFALNFHALPPGRNRAFFFLEADRGTMPVRRRTLKQSSILKKLIAYRATKRLNLHLERFGFPNFRVLTVTTSTDRVETMIDAGAKIAGLPNSFLFTDIATIEASNPLDLSWRNKNGEAVRLAM